MEWRHTRDPLSTVTTLPASPAFPKAGSQKYSCRAWPVSPITQSPGRPVALCLARLTDEVGERKLAREPVGVGRLRWKKSEQGLKDEEINLPGGRQPQSVLHKAVLGPPRTLADGGDRR